MIVSLAGFGEFERYTVAYLKNIGIELRDQKDLLRWLADYEPTRGGLWLPRPSVFINNGPLRQ